MSRKRKRIAVVTGEYNEHGYTIYLDDVPVYSAGNAAEDSQALGTPLPVSVICRYCLRTMRDIVAERRGVWGGVRRVGVHG